MQYLIIKVIHKILKDPIYYIVTAIGVALALYSYGFEPTIKTILLIATAIMLYNELVKTYDYVKYRINSFKLISSISTVILIGITIGLTKELIYFSISFALILTAITIIRR